MNGTHRLKIWEIQGPSQNVPIASILQDDLLCIKRSVDEENSAPHLDAEGPHTSANMLASNKHFTFESKLPATEVAKLYDPKIYPNFS